jgi:Nif-specific regulatory protein
MNYSWPGNVRELENEVTRLVLSVQRKTIREADLSAAIRGRSAAAPAVTLRVSLKEAVAELEKRLIREALDRCGQNQQQAAKALG